jgi:hypothetical protein
MLNRQTIAGPAHMSLSCCMCEWFGGSHEGLNPLCF